MGSPLNLQSVLVRSCDELNWPVWVGQPVIPRKNIRSYEGIQVPDVWFCNGRKFLVQDERRETKRHTCVGIKNRSCDIVRLRVIGERR